MRKRATKAESNLRLVFLPRRRLGKALPPRARREKVGTGFSL
jgi:hypothetical protein